MMRMETTPMRQSSTERQEHLQDTGDAGTSSQYGEKKASN